MALRDKLVERTRPHLAEGEQIYAVMLAQSGPSPYWVFLTYLTMFWNKYLIVVVTDRSIVTFKATAFKPSFVKQPPEMTRYTLRTLGPCSGLWGKIELDGTTFHVHKRFHKDVDTANAYVASLGIAPAQPAAPQPAAAAAVAAPEPQQAPAQTSPDAGWYPDPQQPGAQRYWDGQGWTEHTA